MHLPILYRELLVAPRAPAFYRNRILSSLAFVVIGAGFALLYNRFGLSVAAPILGIIGVGILGTCMFAGASSTADCLAREKREGTIGLLFLTQLRPFEITFGKFIANALQVFYCLIVALPVLSIAILLGGVGGLDLLQFILVGFNTLFVSAAIGLYASATQFDRKKASSQAVWIVLIFWLGTPLLCGLAAELQLPTFVILGSLLFSFFGGLSWFNPVSVATSVRINPALGWLSMLTMHLVGWSFLWLATRALARQWQEASIPRKLTWRERWAKFALGNSAQREARRKKLLEKNPFEWLGSRNRFRPVGVFLLNFAIIGALWLLSSEGTLEIAPLVISVVIASFVQRAQIPGHAASQLVSDQEQGTLELVLSTPASVQEMISGNLRSLWRAFRPTFFGMFSLQIVCSISLFYIFSFSPGDPRFLILLTAIIGFVATHLLSLWSLAWLGMWAATVATDPRKIPSLAVGRSFGVPILLFALATVVILTWNHIQPTNFVPPFQWALLGVVCTFLVNDIFWYVHVKRRLPGEIRAFASRRYSQREPSSQSQRAVQWIRQIFFAPGTKRKVQKLSSAP